MYMTEQLGKIFGSVARVKIMRLFLLNTEQSFSVNQIAERSKVSKASARHELVILKNSGLISAKKAIEEKTTSRGVNKKSVPGFILNTKYLHLEPLKNLLIEADFVNKKDLIKRFRPAGKIKLFLISGIFLKDSKSRIDFMLVGDNLRKNYIETTIRKIESEVGKELSYTVFDTKDFIYRISMYDKLVRDILDAPYESIIEASEFSTYLLKKS